eukprot:scaffold46642_cov57-Phaeocystis_antarctica.AAC.2
MLNAPSAYERLPIGTVVNHPKRGRGIVEDILPDLRRAVRFEKVRTETLTLTLTLTLTPTLTGTGIGTGTLTLTLTLTLTRRETCTATSPSRSTSYWTPCPARPTWSARLPRRRSDRPSPRLSGLPSCGKPKPKPKPFPDPNPSPSPSPSPSLTLTLTLTRNRPELARKILAGIQEEEPGAMLS